MLLRWTLSLLFFSSLAYSAAPHDILKESANLAEATELYRGMSGIFQELCFTPQESGEALYNDHAVFSSAIVNIEDGVFDCDAQMRALKRIQDEIEARAEALRVALNCEPEELINGMGSLMNIGDHLGQNPVCENAQENSMCEDQFACAFASKALPGSRLQSCASIPGQAASCIGTAFYGVFKSLEGAAMFVGSAVNYVGDKVERLGDKVEVAAANTRSRIEGYNSDIVDQVSLLSEADERAIEALKRFSAMSGSEKAAALKNIGSAIASGMNTAIKNNFMCMKWKGAPYESECEEAADSFCTASCDLKTDMLCGLTGFLGAELIIAALTGGSVEVAALAGKGAFGVAGLTYRTSRGVIEEIPGIQGYLGRLSEIRRAGMTRAGAASAEAASRIGRLALLQVKKIQALPITDAIKSGAAKLGTPLERVSHQVFTSSAWNGTRFVAAGAFWPVKEYLKLTDRMYKLGRSSTNQGLSSTASAGSAAFSTAYNSMMNSKAWQIARMSETPLVLEAGSSPTLRVVSIRASKAAPDEQNFLNTQNYYMVVDTDPLDVKASGIIATVKQAGDDLVETPPVAAISQPENVIVVTANRRRPRRSRPVRIMEPNPTIAKTAEPTVLPVVPVDEAADLVKVSRIEELIASTDDLPGLIKKYESDPEFSELFKDPDYPEKPRDLAIVVHDMKRKNPTMSKQKIREEIQTMLRGCSLK